MNREILYKQLTVFVLFAIFLVQSFSSSFVVADYYTNTKAYAANCINKANPQLHCNGKCQMMKKLNEEENKDKQNANRKAGNEDEVLSSRSFFPCIQIAQFCLKSSYASVKPSFTTDRSIAIFHPPQVHTRHFENRL